MTKKQQQAARDAATRYWPICVRSHPMRWYPRGKKAGGYWQCPTCKKGAKPRPVKLPESTVMLCALCMEAPDTLVSAPHPLRGTPTLLCKSCAQTAAGLSA